LTHTFTSDFKHEFEQEREQFLRRRFLWYAGVVVVISVLAIAAGIVAIFVADESAVSGGWANIALSVVLTMVYIVGWIYAYRHLISRERMLRLVYTLIIVNGSLSILASPFILNYTFNQAADRIAKARLEALNAAESTKLPELTEPAADGSQAAAEGGLASEPAPIVPAPRSKKTSIKLPNGIEVHVDDDEAMFLDPERRKKNVARAVVLGNSLASIFFSHFFACLFLPWSPKESIKPIVPLLVLNALVTLFYIRLVPVGGSISLALSPLVAVPGALICLWRHSRFKDQFTYRMLKGRYGEMRQDLGYARKIHESMYPQAKTDGPVRFEYRYEPMRQIGGDYLFAKVGPTHNSSVLNLAIVDVTGHGIGAALTVNRLHGEFERQFGEKPDAQPGEVLRGLNSYLHHTLASHSVYATAVCVQIDPEAGVVRWASAGHPPGFLRSVDGRIDRLDSTTLVLGACRGDDFDPCQEQIRFGPGDTLVLYTDGAIEARNSNGRMLRVEGMQRLVATVRPDEVGGFASAILRAVDEFRFGAPEDDTLIVEIWRPIS